MADKGKKRATEEQTRSQELRETEDRLHRVLRQLDDLGYNHGLASAAVETDHALSLVEFLLKRIDVMRGEVRAAQRAQDRAEQDVRRMREEMRRRDDSSHYTTEDEERRRKTPRLQEEGRSSQPHNLREQLPRHALEPSNWGRLEREVRPLPSSSSTSSSRYPASDISRNDRESSRASSSRDVPRPVVPPPRREGSFAVSTSRRDHSPVASSSRRPRSPVASSSQRDRTLNPPVPRKQTTPSAPREPKQQEEKKQEKKVEILRLTLSLPSTFPPPPVIATQPPAPPTVFPPFHEEDGDEADESSEDEDNIIDRGREETPEEDETDREKRERRARNSKRAEQAKKDDAAAEQNANRLANLHQGRIPDLVGVVQVNGQWERDNRFRGMLTRYLYYYAPENAVYPGLVGRRVFEWESTGAQGTHPALSTRWHDLAPRGFPRTVNEGKKLVDLMKDPSLQDSERTELWMILSEFHRMSLAFVPEQRDHVMNWAANEWNYARRLIRPPQIRFMPVPADKDALNPRNLSRQNQGAGISYPEPESGFDIDRWAQFVAHHGRPGERNQYYGILIDRAFRIHRRSMWGYLLGRSIAPDTREGRAIVMRHFAYVAAIPGLYEQAINRLVPDNHGGLFVSPSVATIEITKFSNEEALAPNFGRDDILHRLILNRIPREWVAHAYHYGYQYLRQHLTTGDRHRVENSLANAERLEALTTRAEPEAYQVWDGWYHPSHFDLVRIHVLIYSEEQRNEFSRNYPGWLAIGEEPTPREFLATQSQGQQPQPSTSTPAGNHNMDPVETSSGMRVVETSSTPIHVEGLAALSVEEAAQEISDVIMSATAAEEEPAHMAVDTLFNELVNFD
jgi:hypothetical protein